MQNVTSNGILSPLLDQTLLIPDFNQYKFHQEFVSRAIIILCSNVSDFKLGANPLRAKSVCCNILSNIMITSHDVASVLRVLVIHSHSYCGFAIKIHGSCRCVLITYSLKFTKQHPQMTCSHKGNATFIILGFC
jgi:hypothetical protein